MRRPARWRTGGRATAGGPFARVYTPADVRLLAAVDEAFGGMSALATREVLRREFEVHGDPRFERLAGISRSHMYNLRASRAYRTRRTVWGRTRPSPVAVAVRRAPEPNGRPGYLRVDTVHLGDRDGQKGVCVVNAVDEVTQHEHVGALPRISERFMAPLLEALLAMFPFRVLGFHAVNGSEHVNHRVAALLNKLRVGEFTKSRARRSNDNALVEGKNAHVGRRRRRDPPPALRRQSARRAPSIARQPKDACPSCADAAKPPSFPHLNEDRRPASLPRHSPRSCSQSHCCACAGSPPSGRCRAQGTPLGAAVQ